MEERLRVGMITSPHGVHGEVNVFPTTDDAERFKQLKKCYIDKKGVLKEVEIDSVKFFKNMVILHFKDIDDRNFVETLKQCDLLIDRADAVPLAEGEFFICDLVGLKVIDEAGTELGVVEDVLQTGANDVFQVKKPDGKELLIPSIKDCILEKNPAGGYIRAHLLPGLEEL